MKPTDRDQLPVGQIMAEKALDRIGRPDCDHVLGYELAVWDVVRDLRTRLERVEHAELSAEERTLKILEAIRETAEESSPDALGAAVSVGDRVLTPRWSGLRPGVVVDLEDGVAIVSLDPAGLQLVERPTSDVVRLGV